MKVLRIVRTIILFGLIHVFSCEEVNSKKEAEDVTRALTEVFEIMTCKPLKPLPEIVDEVIKVFSSLECENMPSAVDLVTNMATLVLNVGPEPTLENLTTIPRDLFQNCIMVKPLEELFGDSYFVLRDLSCDEMRKLEDILGKLFQPEEDTFTIASTKHRQKRQMPFGGLSMFPDLISDAQDSKYPKNEVVSRKVDSVAVPVLPDDSRTRGPKRPRIRPSNSNIVPAPDIRTAKMNSQQSDTVTPDMFSSRMNIPGMMNFMNPQNNQKASTTPVNSVMNLNPSPPQGMMNSLGNIPSPVQAYSAPLSPSNNFNQNLPQGMMQFPGNVQNPVQTFSSPLNTGTNLNHNIPQGMMGFPGNIPNVGKTFGAPFNSRMNPMEMTNFPGMMKMPSDMFSGPMDSTLNEMKCNPIIPHADIMTNFISIADKMACDSFLPPNGIASTMLKMVSMFSSPEFATYADTMDNMKNMFVEFGCKTLHPGEMITEMIKLANELSCSPFQNFFRFLPKPGGASPALPLQQFATFFAPFKMMGENLMGNLPRRGSSPMNMFG